MEAVVAGIASILGIVGFAVIMAYRNRRARDERIRRAFTATPITSIGEVRHGQLVVVVGTVHCEQARSAPMTGRPCAAYELVRQKDRDKVWVEVHRSVEANDFTITDASGSALVRGGGHVEFLSKREREQVSDLEPYDPQSPPASRRGVA